MKRICVVWHACYPWDVRLEKMASALLEQKYEVNLLCRGKTGMPEREAAGALSIERVSADRRCGKAASLARRILGLPFPGNPYWIYRGVRWMRATRGELIIARDLPIAWLGVLLGRLFRVPVIFDMAENYPAAMLAYEKKIYRYVLFGNAFLARLYERMAAVLSDHIFVVAHEQKYRLRSLGIAGGRISVVHNTPELSRLRSAVRAEPDPQRKTILYTGKIDAHRGVDVAVRALPYLVNRFPTVVLVLAGTGTWLEQARRTAAELSVSAHVRFLGWVSHERVYELIAQSDVCIIPHLKSEHTDTTIPNKLFDYMLFGKPVVSSNLRPVESILSTYQCGLAFRSGDPKDLSEKLLRMLEGSEAKSFGDRGRSAVERRFHWGVDARIVVQAAGKLLEGSAAVKNEKKAKRYGGAYGARCDADSAGYREDHAVLH